MAWWARRERPRAEGEDDDDVVSEYEDAAGVMGKDEDEGASGVMIMGKETIGVVGKD